ncbi:MAG: 6-phospho-beta-glucosidase [Aggregatilineales bacterium]
MKIVVIGGGSTYTPELVKGFINTQATLPLTELCLMDIDAHRLEIVGGFAQRMVTSANGNFDVTLTTHRKQAIKDAAYVITQFRVGGMHARREDEYLGRRHGIIGQETTGVGGMAKALRTIPIILDIAREMRELAPNAPLINFTNPAGLVTQALVEYAPEIVSIGVCNVPMITKMRLLDGLATRGITVEPQRAELDTLGLNHLSWHRGLTIDGEDVWSQVLEGLQADPEAFALGSWDSDTLNTLHMIPNYYLEYFYYTEKKRQSQDAWPPSRAEEVMDIERELLAYYANTSNDIPPESLEQRGGAYYSTVATLLVNAHHNDTGEVHVVNTLNNGAVVEWPDNWVLELPAHIDRQGAHPLPAQPLPLEVFGLIATIKSYELLTVEAAVHGDLSAIRKALLAHPLGPPADHINAVIDDLLTVNRDYLPQFAAMQNGV